MASPITVADVKDRLLGVHAWLTAAKDAPQQYNDAKIANNIPAAVRQFERETKLRLNAIQVVGGNVASVYDDGAYTGQNTQLPIVRETPYAYFRRDAEALFAFNLRHRPVRKIQRMRIYLGQKKLWQVPPEWEIVDNTSARVHLVPVYGSLQLAAGDVAYTILTQNVRNHSHLPQAIAVDYEAGLEDGWQDQEEWADLRRVLSEAAAKQVLDDISEMFDAGVLQNPTSADGLFTGVQLERFQRRRQELQQSVDAFKETLQADQMPIMMTSI